MRLPPLSKAAKGQYRQTTGATGGIVPIAARLVGTNAPFRWDRGGFSREQRLLVERGKVSPRDQNLFGRRSVLSGAVSCLPRQRRDRRGITAGGGGAGDGAQSILSRRA
jgi:hypothetical protein